MHHDQSPPDSSTIESIIQAMRHPAYSTDMRGEAIGLTRRGEDGITALISLLADLTAGNEARRWAAIALGQSHNSRVLSPLISALQDDSELYLPLAAAIALGELGLPGAVPALVAALADTRRLFGDAPNIAMQALESIGQASIPALIAALTDGPPQQRRWAARVLGKLGRPDDPSLLEHLRAALRDTDSLVRWEAVDAFEAVAGTGALSDIRPLLADPDADVRDSVITILGLRGDNTDIPALEDVRDHDVAANWEGDQLSETAEWAMEHIREHA